MASGLIRPNDKELMNLLMQKILGIDHPTIPVLNVNGYEPWELAQLLGAASIDREWYFFRQCRQGERNSRTTEKGYWHVTGKGCKIKDRQKEIGTKTFLVYYEGRTPNGVRTRWIMHQYNLTPNLPNPQVTFVLCKLMDKSENEGSMPNYNEGGEPGYYNLATSDSYPINYSTSDSDGNSNTIQLMTSENQEIGGIPQQVGYAELPLPESFHGWNVPNSASEWQMQAEQCPYFVPNSASEWQMQAEQCLYFGTPMFRPQANQFYGAGNYSLQ